MADVFADMIGRIDYANGHVRIELMTLEPPAKDDAAPQPARCARLIMPISGFLHGAGALSRMKEEMEARGVAKRPDADTGDANGAKT